MPHNPHVLQASALIEQRFGLAATTQFRTDLDAILSFLADGELEQYVRVLQRSPETDPSWQKLVHTLTIGETYFLRDRGHFHVLKSHVLPEIIRQRRAQSDLRLTIWSAGCATGEEAYSIAFVLHELLPDLPRWTITLIGTDINDYALRMAQSGVYRDWSFRHTDDTLQRRYFDAHSDGWKIKRDIQQMVRFQHTNLLTGAPLNEADVIFCRNVLIYFENSHIAPTENLLFKTLNHAGWLFLGQAEAVRSQRERWMTHIFSGAVVYQKPDEKMMPSVSYQLHKQAIPHTAPIPDASEDALTNYADAVQAVQSERYDDAERDLAEVLAQHPNHAQAHALLANIFANRRALPEAQAHIETALHLDPLLADAHYLRAMLMLEEGKRAEAQEALKAALYCRRDHPLAAFMLGSIYAQAGDKERASRVWEEARRAITPLRPESHVSDLSDLTAAGLRALISKQLEKWQT
jgi:chemotaxis protein methyltransferase CheR